jgi:hypothetical protein
VDGDEGKPAAAAAVLRRAADELGRLRELVPSGRWSARGLLATRPEIVAENTAGHSEHVADARRRSAEWILAMAPAVASPLIAWLRETADALEQPELGLPTSTAAAAELASHLLDRVDVSGPRARARRAAKPTDRAAPRRRVCSGRRAPVRQRATTTGRGCGPRRAG